MSQDASKAAAAEAAVTHVRSGMTLGLGTGSTMAFALQILARRMREEGLDIRGVPTSTATEAHARELGIPLVTLDTHPRLDLAIDGADEVDDRFAMIKGGGGALLREKIVAHAADHVIIVVDPTKVVTSLGAFPLPVEVVPFGVTPFRRMLEAEGASTSMREYDGARFVTDEGHWIVDVRFPAPLLDPAAVHRKLVAHPAVVETGLFVGLLDTLIIGSPEGTKTVTSG